MSWEQRQKCNSRISLWTWWICSAISSCQALHIPQERSGKNRHEKSIASLLLLMRSETKFIERHSQTPSRTIGYSSNVRCRQRSRMNMVTTMPKLVDRDTGRWSQRLISMHELSRLLQSDFDNPLIDRIKSNAHAAKSQIAGAGQGLFASRDLEAGVVVGLYAIHGIHDKKQNLLFPFRENMTISSFSKSHTGPAHPESADFFLGVDGSRTNPPGWLGSLVNDAAQCNGSSLDEISSYYDTAIPHANCMYNRLGPPPLMAIVTIRSVKAGEELLLPYMAPYWHGLYSIAANKSREVVERERDAFQRHYANGLRAYELLNENYGKEITELRSLDLDIRGKNGEWKPLACLDEVTIGTPIRVTANMSSDDDKPVQLFEGMRGSVQHVHEAGYIGIYFIGETRHWVRKHSFENLEYLHEA